MKHKHKEMGLDDLIVRLRIEEDNRIFDKKSGKLPIESKANLVEQKTSKKMKYFGEGPNQGKSKFKKFNEKCYRCNKQSHQAKGCCSKGHDKKNQVHMTEEEKLANDVSNLMLSNVVFEATMVDNPKEWWIDIGATHHVCSDRKMFSSYV